MKVYIAWSPINGSLLDVYATGKEARKAIKDRSGYVVTLKELDI